MGVYIKGLKTLPTGMYLVSVDNTNGHDETVVAIERLTRNREVYQIVGVFEVLSPPPHGKLVDLDAWLASYSPGLSRVLLEASSAQCLTVIPEDPAEEEE